MEKYYLEAPRASTDVDEPQPEPNEDWDMLATEKRVLAVRETLLFEGNALGCHLQDKYSQWWQNNALHFPTLASIALDVLPCPASSVPSEQSFSAAGITAEK
ncbi:hypothetical protein APHAL10511_008712 [Amanita phalloides]|nr:hypothetical protein APHAL10511_008712 [Amanita phalloides]